MPKKKTRKKKIKPVIIRGLPTNFELRKVYGISKKEWDKMQKDIKELLRNIECQLD